MSWLDEEGLAFERYEQREPLRLRIDLSRRGFLQVLGGGLLVAVLAPRSALGAPGRGEERSAAPQPLDAWLRIGPDGSITVFTGKVEVGQGIRTSLAQAVADELAVDVSAIRMVMGDTDLTPYDRGTHGSQSTPRMAPQLRAAAASTRMLLLALAAESWGTRADALRVANGAVVDPKTDRRIGYGALVKGRDLSAELDPDAAPVPHDRWRQQGKPVRRVDAREIVTGQRTYVSDVQLPGMQHGRVLRPPSWGAELLSVETKAAAALPGVTVVHDGDFVGVVAPDPQLAADALKKIEARWRERPGVDSKDLFAHLESHPIEREGWGGRRSEAKGDFDRAVRKAKQTFTTRYTVPYIAHAPLEPRAAVAQWVGSRLLVWTGTQHPFPVRDDVAHAMGIEPDRVRVRVPDTGSGYGGKHSAEAAIEAARLARGAKVPVKLVWTRSEEFAWAYFRPAGVMAIRSGVDARGKITAWSHTNFNSGGSALECPYAIEHQRVVFQPTESPARQGSYRGLAATANCFARESHIDEIAAATGTDPVELRRAHLDDARLRAVLDAAVAEFGWKGPRLGPRRGAGVAIGRDKGGSVCTVAEVEIGDDDTLRIARLVTAFECGAIVNPDNLRNQIEGGVIMGLGGALFEEIVLAGGMVANGRFSKYRVPRFPDVPPLQTVLVDRPDLPSAGAGETPIVAVAPAIANAIFHAMGRRIRDLPLAPDGRLKRA